MATVTALAAAPAALQPTTYPAAHRGDIVDDYFGTKVPDPYRWMEDIDLPDVKKWIEQENAATATYLSTVPGRDAMKKRLLALTDYERFSLPSKDGGRYLYRHNSGLQNQSVLYWTQGIGGEPKVLIDPNTLSKDGTVALGGTDVTRDGRLMAYSTSEAGSDWQTWRVREIETGIDLPDVILRSKFSGASWTHDGSGFYYSGYAADAEKDEVDVPPEKSAAGSMKAVNRFPKIYFHKLGTPQAEDKLIFERPDDPEVYLGVGVSDDGRWLYLSQSKGSKNALSVKDLSKPDAPLIKVVTIADARFDPIENQGTTLWMLTNRGAPGGKVVAVDLDNPDDSKWKTIVPEQPGRRIDGVSLVGGRLIVDAQADARSRVELWSPDGSAHEDLKLPGVGTVGGFGGRKEDGETFFVFSNMQTPSTIYRLDLKSMEQTVYRQPKLLFDPAAFESVQVFYPSKDGTKIPMTISFKKGIKLDGTNPTILYGYGGFDISLLPEFSASRLLWMERGGIYAQANLRGGGEYGESWHLAGTKLNKQNVFDDFVAGAEWLISNKYTSPAKLAINGGSNGGLLVGAVELQRPDLFGAAVAAVGVMDMLRFDKFTVGFGWKNDYGSPSENEAEFRAIYKYSPVQNVAAGIKYPPTLITTGDHDDRVFPAHSFKFAAAMQAEDAARAAATGTPLSPILIRVETRAGHGGGMPLAKQLDLTVDVYSFLEKSLGVPAAGGG